IIGLIRWWKRSLDHIYHERDIRRNMRRSTIFSAGNKLFGSSTLSELCQFSRTNRSVRYRFTRTHFTVAESKFLNAPLRTHTTVRTKLPSNVHNRPKLSPNDEMDACTAVRSISFTNCTEIGCCVGRIILISDIRNLNG
ncbi:hypothetical protein ACH5RR_008488, partial [Cinchona calisaya]